MLKEPQLPYSGTLDDYLSSGDIDRVKLTPALRTYFEQAAKREHDAEFGWMRKHGATDEMLDFLRESFRKAERHLSLECITFRRQQMKNESSYNEARTDELTIIPNRKAFTEVFSKLIRNSKRLDNHQYGLLFIDLKKFKQVNDTYGHNTGDDALKAVAVLLADYKTEEDFIARLAGDEFVVLVDITESPKGISGAVRKLNRMAKGLHTYHEDTEIPIGLSVGSHVIGAEAFKQYSRMIRQLNSEEEPEAVKAIIADNLNRADMAMYEAKKAANENAALEAPAA